MPLTNETMANFSRYLSLAVLSCLLITGGMWLYHNRAEIVSGAGAANKDGGTWFTRWAGIDASKLKDEYTRNLLSEQVKPFKSDFEFDPDWLQKAQGNFEFNWDSNR